MCSTIAVVLEGSRVAVIGIDPCKFTAVYGYDSLNVNVSLALRRAVTTASVQLAIVLHVEVLDTQRVSFRLNKMVLLLAGRMRRANNSL